MATKVVNNQTVGGMIRIKANGNLVNAAASGVNLEASDILLEAGPGAIGETAKAVTVHMRGTGGLIARALGDIRITAPTSDLRLESVYSRSGNAILEATTKSILDSLAGSTATKVQAQHIKLTAGETIGTDVNDVEIDVMGIVNDDLNAENVNRGTIIAEAGGSIYLTETQGDMNVRLVRSTGGDVRLTARAQSILDAELPELDENGQPFRPDADVIGKNVTLTAEWWIGALGDELDIDSSYLDTSDSTVREGVVTISTGQESVYLVETAGDLRLNQIETDTTPSMTPDDAVVFITAINGSILNGRSDTQANVLSRRTYLLASQNIGVADKRIVSQVADLQSWSQAGSSYIHNLGGLTVTNVSGGVFGAQGGGSVNITASSPVTVDQNVSAVEDVVITAEDKAGTLDDILVKSGFTVQSTGGSVYLLAGDDVEVEAGAIVEAAVKIEIAGDYQAEGVADPDAGTGSTITLNGSFRAPTIEIRAGGDVDTITIDVVALRGNTVVKAGAGDDTITIVKLPTMDTYLGVVVAGHGSVRAAMLRAAKSATN